jgi:hypothetical protein
LSFSLVLFFFLAGARGRGAGGGGAPPGVYFPTAKFVKSPVPVMAKRLSLFF